MQNHETLTKQKNINEDFFELEYRDSTKDKSTTELKRLKIKKKSWFAYVELLKALYCYNCLKQNKNKTDENLNTTNILLQNTKEFKNLNSCIIKCWQVDIQNNQDNLNHDKPAFDENVCSYLETFPENSFDVILSWRIMLEKNTLFSKKNIAENDKGKIKEKLRKVYLSYKFHYEKEIKRKNLLSPTKRSSSVPKKSEIATSPIKLQNKSKIYLKNSDPLYFSFENLSDQEKIDELNNEKLKLENDLNQVKELNEKLSQDNGTLKNELNNTNGSLISLQNEIKNIKNECDELNKKVQEQENSIKKNIDKLNSNKSEIQTLKDNNKELNEAKEKLIEENKKFKSENEQLKANLKSTEKSEINLKKQIENLKKENETIKNKFEEAEQKVQKYKISIQEKENQINQNQTEIQTLKNENEKFKNEVNELKSQIDKLNKKLEEKDELISKNDLEQAEIQKLKSENEQLNIDLANLKKEQNEKDSKADQTINELNQVKENLEKELQNSQTSMNEINKKDEELQQQLQKQIKELEEKIQEQNEIVAKNESYQTEIQNLNSQKEQLEKNLNESKTSIANLQNEIENLKSYKHETDNLNKDLQNQINELQEKQKIEDQTEANLDVPENKDLQNKSLWLKALFGLSLIIGSVLLVTAIVLCPPVSAAIGFTIFAAKTAGFILTGILFAFGILIPFFGFFVMKNLELNKNVSDLNKNNLLTQENESIVQSQNKNENENRKDLINLDKVNLTNSLIVKE